MPILEMFESPASASAADVTGARAQANGLFDQQLAIYKRAASETRSGIAELATQAETNTGTDDLRIVTPLKLATRAATETLSGLAEIATQAEVDAGTDDSRIVTPLKLSSSNIGAAAKVFASQTFV